jgi:MYXO-CTERM domain-containing protein
MGAAGGTANASVLWHLNDFSFDDGATASGWFNWDETSNKATSWNIAATAGTLPAFTYTDSNSATYTTFAGDNITFYIGNRQFRIGTASADAFDTPSAHLAPFGSNGNVGSYGYLECINCSPYRIGQSGAYLSAQVQPTTVPEPSTAALGLLALGLLVAVRRKA